MMKFEIVDQERRFPVMVRIGKNSMPVDATWEQLELYREGQVPIQVALPDASPDQREFLISGMTPAQWGALNLDEEDPRVNRLLMRSSGTGR